MYFFQPSLQFASVALMLPALLASAYPHSHERRIGLVDELVLFHYPSVASNVQATPFVTLVLGEKRTTEVESPDGGTLASYDVEWKEPGGTTETPAIAVQIEEAEYDEIKRVFSVVGTFLGSGQDAQQKVWIIVSRSTSEEPDQEEEPSEESFSSDDTNSEVNY